MLFFVPRGTIHYATMKYIIPLIIALSFSFLSCKKESILINWERLNGDTRDDLQAIHFQDSLNGVAIGGSIWSRGIATYTYDGGKSWRSDSLQGWSLYGLAVDSLGSLYTVGISGSIFKKEKNDSLFRWVGQPFGHFFRDIILKNDNLILVGGQAWKNGLLVQLTKDMKVSTVDSSFNHEIASVCFSDNTTVHAVGYGIVLRSQNAGKTWQVHSTNGDFFKSICFPTSLTGYAVGAKGTIIKTMDGGITWEKIEKPSQINPISFNSVFFIDQLRGYICGNTGLLWYTQDGGKSWIKFDNLPKINFYDVYINEFGWLVGEQGTIIKFDKY